MKMSVSFLGFNMFTGSLDILVSETENEILKKNRRCRVIYCLNPHSYVESTRDSAFHKALTQSDWLLPDGIGVVAAAKWLNIEGVSRISGPDAFLAIMEKLNKSNGSVFFLGSSELVLKKINDKVRAIYPNVVILGTFSPPFKDEFSLEENAAMVSAINSVSPDLLWVGMTAPKQEKWLAEHRTKLDVGVAGAVGAAFDFFAGTVKRPPQLFQVLGLEWLPRLVRQPIRLWRRMFISAPLFIFWVWKAKYAKQRNDEGRV